MTEDLVQMARDAARYRWLREQMTWADAGDGSIKWVVYIPMRAPDISDGALSNGSVAAELDVAIDAEIASK